MKPSSEIERAVGMEWYATGSQPCRARAKSRTGDFVVEEQISLDGVAAEERPGYYPLYRVEKRHVDTMHMAEELARALKSRVSYGGLKDKRSESVQYATPTSLRASRPQRVERERFTASLVGYVSKPISRGAVVGNRFELTLRDCCAQIGDGIEETMRYAEARRLPNYYGLQRFGTMGAGTHRIGRALVSRDFEEAVRLMLSEPRESDDESLAAAREAVSRGDYAEAGRLLPDSRDVERRVARELGRRPGDWLRALRAVPVKLRRLYVHAYQSLVFNRTLSSALARGEDISTFRPGDNWAQVSADGLVTSRVMGVKDTPAPGAVPMVQVAGYAYRDYGSRFDSCLKEVLDDEGISPGQFYVQEMQEVSSEGGFRRPHMAVRDSSWAIEGDVARLEFTLARGMYATVLLREVVKPDDPVVSGLA